MRWFLPLLIGDELVDKAAQERAVRGSGLAWTIVRPAILKNGAATGRPLRVDEALPFRVGASVRRADLAHLLVDLLDDPRSHSLTLEVSA